MVIEHSIIDNILLLKPLGRIDSSSSSSFEEQCLHLIGKQSQKTVIDLSGVDYISSAGLRVLLIGAKTAKAAGGALTLCSLQGSVKEVVCLSGFDSLLGAHKTVAEAIMSLET